MCLLWPQVENTVVTVLFLSIKFRPSCIQSKLYYVQDKCLPVNRRGGDSEKINMESARY